MKLYSLFTQQLESEFIVPGTQAVYDIDHSFADTDG